MKNFGINLVGIQKYLTGTSENGIQLLYNGPLYYLVRELMKKENPESYNALLKTVAKNQNPHSEVVIYTDANGKQRNATNVGAGFVSGTDPIGVEVVAGAVLGKPLELAGKAAMHGVTKLINPGFGKFNWFTKKFYPHKAKRLDELQHQRLFIKEHPYEYVSNSEVINAIDVADDGKHLYRSVHGDRGIPYSRINTETNFSTEVELIDPMTGKLLYNDAPTHTAWTSTRPKYVDLNSKEIHILPESDFTFVKRMNENRKSAGYVNSFDKDSRIVNSSGFNLNSGSHFIKIPQANSFARMKNGIDYNTSLYKSPISNYSTLFPGIGRGPNGWNIHKAYKLGLIGAGTVGGMVYGLNNL